MASSFTFVSPLTWWMDCKMRKKTPKDVQTFNMVPFSLDKNVDFVGSRTLKNGRSGTIFAGVAGYGIFNAISRANPLVGAAAGFIVGNIVDRIVNPTKKIRELILTDYKKFIITAIPEIITYILQVHQKLLQNVTNEIIANYENSMKKTVLLLVRI